ncbi:hypothetical protein PN36_05525 [Candidatus Thiomargarita nelsonii]|uniref:Uncharacterized protein n=1 Tax=Candidatus Thiomargarita nelsonii TaxID=1003181 RepID=A0A0A6P9U9_9GAMM|nr:hypothetical protein PN36_05525 [Candidatus Thiomargarita nelsonii]
MTHVWQLQEAENHFSEIIINAEKSGAQLLKPKNSLVKFFQQSPLVGVSLDLERSQDTGREINT